MISVKIKTYKDIEVSGELNMVVYRKFIWTSKIILTFIKDNSELLKASYYSLIPFCVIKVYSYDLPELELSKNRTKMFIDDYLIEIDHNFFSPISDDLCSILLYGEKICEVKKNTTFEGIDLKLNLLKEIKSEVKLYCTILVILKYFQIDQVA